MNLSIAGLPFFILAILIYCAVCAIVRIKSKIKNSHRLIENMIDKEVFIK